MTSVKLSDHYNYKNIFRTVTPPVLMMIFTSVYTIVDGIFVSNIAGKTPFAALNLIYPVISAVGAIGFMLGAGGSALVAKTLGEGDKEKANRYFTMIIIFSAIGGVVFGVPLAIAVEPISKLLGATPEMLPYCVTYGRILLACQAAFFLPAAFNSFFLVAERPKLGFLVSLISGCTNIAFDAIFMLGFKLGLMGAALGTITSWIVGTVISVVYFCVNKTSNLRFTRTKLEFKPLLQASFNGLSELLSNIAMSVMGILYNMQLMKLVGEDGVSAYGIMIYVGFVFSAVFFGYDIGISPPVSYHFGAKNNAELKSLLKKSLIIVISLGVLMTVLAESLATPLSKIFVSYDKNLLDMTVHGLRIYAASFVLIGVNVFASAFFTALNDGLTSAVISFMRTLVFQVIAVMTLPLLLQLDGVWMSQVIAELLALAVTITCFAVKKKKYGY